MPVAVTVAPAGSGVDERRIESDGDPAGRVLDEPDPARVEAPRAVVSVPAIVDGRAVRQRPRVRDR